MNSFTGEGIQTETGIPLLIFAIVESLLWLKDKEIKEETFYLLGQSQL